MRAAVEDRGHRWSSSKRRIISSRSILVRDGLTKGVVEQVEGMGCRLCHHRHTRLGVMVVCGMLRWLSCLVLASMNWRFDCYKD